MKIKAIEQQLVSNGWTLVRAQGSHRHYAHNANAKIVTVAGKPRDDMTPGQLASLRRITGLPLR